MARKAAILLKCFWGIFPIFLKHTACSLYEEQLYEDLLYLYNRVARPVKNTSDILTITMGASLIRIIEIRWTDAKLSWNPQKYGGLKRLHIPTDEIWTPDIVLYNHAAGHPEITIYTDAFVYYDGTVVWRPPAIYKAFCHIDVTWFPFDSQKCQMKFGVWTYTGSYIDMRHLPDQEVLLRNSNGKQYEYLQQGMDLSYFYDFLTTFIFYLSDHKITLAISMLVTLIVFFLVLIELIPPTSLVIPMFGRYLLTTMILVTLGIVISVISVNFNFRCGTMETMAPWIRKVFLQILPKILRMKMPQLEQSKKKTSTQQILKNLDSVTLQRSEGHKKRNSRLTRIQPPPIPSPPMIVHSHSGPLEDSANSSPSFVGGRKSPANQQQFQIHVHRQLILRVLQHVRFIADHFKLHEEEGKVSSEWTFVAMVMDRLFLVIFAVLNIFSVLILLQAPSLYDKSEPLTAPSPTKPLGQDTLGRSFHLYE